jgi:DNA replication licensing factor MCM3
VATKVSAIKPKIVKSVHYCPSTKQHTTKDYVDATDPRLGLPAVDNEGRELPDRIVNITSSIYPQKDAQKNPLETEFGYSQFKDHQTIVLQEMPEKAPMGQLPRSIELVLDYDLVDRIKPGDRVEIVGVYRALATSANGQSTTSGLFKTVVLVNHVRILGRDVSQLNLSIDDLKNIQDLSTSSNILDVLGRSLAPSIHGHEIIKKALILQLLSGVEKNLENGTHLRGDINILMVGDPSTAKSQLLRSVMTIAPLAVSTTGKGSSGVGLTAAVTSDPDTRERRLEAGAMVLADRGIVCVDEFDKMSEADRVAIHEAMEQQTVTIAKAGIHASLNARCSVLAAANPVYGQYDRKKRIQDNIGLPDSLLSRFDLLFVVLDQLDPDTDRQIASHVIRGHRYKPGHGTSGHDSDDDDDDDDGFDSDMDDNDENHRPSSIWQKSRYVSEVSRNAQDVLHHDFLRKYLHYAKTRIKPILTDEARECIASRYAEMRSRQDERTLPVTARSLETVIRLASAHAKARLSRTVEADLDVSAAMDILSFALYHENNNNAPENRSETPDLEDQRPGKRMRQSETDGGVLAENQEETVGPEQRNNLEITMERLRTRIWHELRANDGNIAIEELCPGEDRDLLLEVIRQLEDEEIVTVNDGYVLIM